MFINVKVFSIMDAEVLNRVTFKLLIPKFEWIGDFYWDTEIRDGRNVWTLYVKPNKLSNPLWGLNPSPLVLDKEAKNLFRFLKGESEDEYNKVVML